MKKYGVADKVSPLFPMFFAFLLVGALVVQERVCENLRVELSEYAIALAPSWPVDRDVDELYESFVSRLPALCAKA